MLVEKAFSIDGKIVSEVFQNRHILVYQYDNEYDSMITLYFVNRANNEVMFKQEIDADCNQNTGYISRLDFVGL